MPHQSVKRFSGQVALKCALTILLNVFAWVEQPYAMFLYWRRAGQFPNAAFPRSFNEKVLWRKVFDRDERFGVMTNKLAARDLVRKVAPSVRHPDILWEGSNIEQMPPEILANPCVIKTNRGSGSNLINWIPNQLDKQQIVKHFRPLVNRVYGVRKGEWSYGMFTQRFFVEELHLGEDGTVPDDFNLHTFNGSVATITMIHNRFADRAHISLMRDLSRSDTVWEKYCSDYEPAFDPIHYTIPDIAECLGQNIDYVRVDVYVHCGEIYFREFTFFPGSGLSVRNVGEMELMRNALWDLSKTSFFFQSAQWWKGAYKYILDTDLCAAKQALNKLQLKNT